MKTALSPLLDENTPEGKENAERLWRFLTARVAEVDSAMGWWRKDCALYELQADNQFDFRKTGAQTDDKKIVFDYKNDSFNCVRGVARYMRGRCEGDLFGGTPFMATRAEGLQDDDLADAIQKHFDFKLRQANYRAEGKTCVGTVIDLGTAVQKTTWKVVSEPFMRLSNVFHGPDDEPVLETSETDPVKGDYVEDGHPALSDGKDGQTFYQPPGAKEDGRPIAPIVGQMKERYITEPNVKFKGLSIEGISYKNLLAPMDVAKFEDANLLGHFYDIAFLDLQQHYDPQGNDPDLKKVWDQLRSYQNGAPTGDRAPQGQELATNSQPEDENPLLQIHELRLRFALDGKNVRRLYVVVHLPTTSVIYADYLGNVTPGGDLDMHPVAINKVPGRWYGRGYFQTYAMLQRIIDRCLNEVEYHNDFHTNPVVILHKSIAEETDAEGTLRLWPGRVFTATGQSVDPSVKLLEIITLPDLSERTWAIMELAMQILQQDSGVTAAAQGDPGALPSVSTATGTNAILASGSTMHQLIIDDLREGLEPSLTYAIRLLYSRQDADETFSYMEGSRAVQDLISLADAQKLSKLYLHVSLSLTRLRDQDDRQNAQGLINAGIQYFTLAPPVQMAMRPAYIQLAKGFKMENAEGLFPLPQMPPPMVPGALPGMPGDPGEDPNALALPAPAADASATPAAPVPPPTGGPLIPSILTTGAAPAAPLPLNVIAGTPPPNQGGF